MAPALYEAKVIVVKELRRCALCGVDLPPGRVLRVRWSRTRPGGRIASFGYYHLESCGPAMVKELEEMSQQIRRVHYEGSEG